MKQNFFGVFQSFFEDMGQYQLAKLDGDSCDQSKGT